MRIYIYIYIYIYIFFFFFFFFFFSFLFLFKLSSELPLFFLIKYQVILLVYITTVDMTYQSSLEALTCEVSSGITV